MYTGIQVAYAVCTDLDFNNRILPDNYCSGSEKPTPIVRHCGSGNCAPRWGEELTSTPSRGTSNFQQKPEVNYEIHKLDQKIEAVALHTKNLLNTLLRFFAFAFSPYCPPHTHLLQVGDARLAPVLTDQMWCRLPAETGAVYGPGGQWTRLHGDRWPLSPGLQASPRERVSYDREHRMRHRVGGRWVGRGMLYTRQRGEDFLQWEVFPVESVSSENYRF